MSCGILGGKQKINFAPMQEIAVNFVYSLEMKRRFGHVKCTVRHDRIRDKSPSLLLTLLLSYILDVIFPRKGLI